jgi:hypothetical protein
VHKHPYPSSLALKGFFAQSQTHLIAPASGAAIIFPVPLHPINALAPSMPAHAVGSDLTAADAGQKRDRSRLSKTATHVTGDTRALPVANLRTIDVAEPPEVYGGRRQASSCSACWWIVPSAYRLPTRRASSTGSIAMKG